MPPVVVKRGDPVPESFTRSVFVVGADGASWESDMLAALASAGLDEGVVFIGDECAEPDGNGWRAQVMKMSDAIICYVAGEESAMGTYMATEIVRWVTTGQLFCAAPEGSWADELCANATHKVVPERSLEDLAAKVSKAISAGAERKAAERQVPLMVWRTPSWKLWYENLLSVGNRLDGATVDWTFRVGPGGVFMLFWAVHANIWVESECRNKSNEVVIARPDVCCTLAYLPGSQLLDTEIVVIKEFRSPCRNEHGFVYELPGGSSFKPQSDIYQTAADELREETGITVDKSRLKKEMSRQAAATVTTHHVHLFSCKLTPAEMDVARQLAESKATFGNADETEQTFIEIMTLREALPSSKVDFTTLGMCLQTIGLAYDVDTTADTEQALSKDEALSAKVLSAPQPAQQRYVC